MNLRRAILPAATSWYMIAAGSVQAQTSAAVPPAAGSDSATNTQPREAAPELAEIVVTAQKRSQSIDTVPMSITAVTGDQLALLGVKTVDDLDKFTPGFSAGKSNVGTPVYTMRGVGYNDNSIAARPAVTVYLDEAPLPFSFDSKGVGLDVERVEVLKGPQGTLFGSNSTGGAINYIAVKPTDTFQAADTLTYGRFNQLDLESYVSGPLTDTLSARIAVEHDGRSGWQYSTTRPGDSLGKKDFTNARLILLWKPSSDLTTQLTVSGWIDRGDTEATQVTQVHPQVPPFVPLTQVGSVRLTQNNARAADWDPNSNPVNDNRYVQTSLRIDYDLSPELTLTSLTNYINLRVQYLSDSGGTGFADGDDAVQGYADSFSQELRIAGNFGRLNALLGAVYGSDRSQDNLTTLFSGSTLSPSFTRLGAPLWTSVTGYSQEDAKNYAVFGNAEYTVIPELTVQGGVRYTESDLNAGNCSRDYGDGNAAAVFRAYASAVRAGAGLGPIPLPAPGSCVSLFAGNPVTDPASFLTPGEVYTKLDENNVSWRTGVQYTPISGTLLYANVSKGYKEGGFSPFGTLNNASYTPAVQESVLSYEAGFKSRLLDRMLQLNGAAYYMDYRNKQVLGNFTDPVLGASVRLVNIPKSRIEGAELSLVATPTTGLTIVAAGSYTKTEVLDGFTGTNANNVVQNFTGTSLPYAPRVQLSGSVNYRWGVKDKVDAFVNASETYQSKSYSYLGEVSSVELNPHALTDLEAGFEGSNGKWRAYLWGRNVFNKYYWTAAARIVDTSVKWAAMPATYGVTLSLEFE